MLRTAVLLLIAIISFACTPKPNERTEGRLLSREKGMAVAAQAAKAHGFVLSEYYLDTFGEQLSADGSEWLFVYNCQPVPAPGCHFMVVVNRHTGQTKVFPGE